MEYYDAPDAADLPDPFDAPAPTGLPAGYFMHHDFWPVPTAFAFVPGAIGAAILEGTPADLAGIATAVDRWPGTAT